MVSVEEGDGLAVSDDDYESDFPIIGDLLESLTPWRTGDLGCVSIRREGDFSVNEEETGMTEDPQVIAEAERIRAEEEAANEAKLAKSRASLALIQLIQSAIERREALLRQMGEEPGLPASQAGGNSARTPVSRLALERHVDQALAREDLESVDLAAARLDMSELLPRAAADPRYSAAAGKAAGAAALADASTGKGTYIDEPESVYSYYDDYDGASHYTCARNERKAISCSPCFDLSLVQLSGLHHSTRNLPMGTRFLRRYESYDAGRDRDKYDEYADYYDDDDAPPRIAPLPLRAPSAIAPCAYASATAANRPSCAPGLACDSTRASSTEEKRPNCVSSSACDSSRRSSTVSLLADQPRASLRAEPPASEPRPATPPVVATAADSLMPMRMSTGAAPAVSANPNDDYYYSEDEYYSEEVSAGAGALPRPAAEQAQARKHLSLQESQQATQQATQTAQQMAGQADHTAARLLSVSTQGDGPLPLAAPSMWDVWAQERAQHMATQRAQYLTKAAGLRGSIRLPSVASTEDFLNQCVLGMREGAGAVLLNDPSGREPIAVHLELSPPPEAGLKLVWSPIDGKPDGYIRTLDIQQVLYCPEAPTQHQLQYPLHTRFVVMTSDARLEFSMPEALELQFFVCGLRHLANQPVARERFLWQRAAALHEDGLRAASFDERLLGGAGGEVGGDSLSSFLSKQRLALEGLAGGARS